VLNEHDLDALLARPESHATAHNDEDAGAADAGSGLLDAFNVSNVDMDSFWDQVIPEDERSKQQEEAARLARQAADLESMPRASRLKDTDYSEAGQAKAAAAGGGVAADAFEDEEDVSRRAQLLEDRAQWKDRKAFLRTFKLIANVRH